jgi:hypothetical protein
MILKNGHYEIPLTVDKTAAADENKRFSPAQDVIPDLFSIIACDVRHCCVLLLAIVEIPLIRTTARLKSPAEFPPGVQCP